MQAETLSAKSTTPLFMSPSQLLEHWQGHRNLTRRMILAFPEDELFSFSVGGMRPFGELAMEMLVMGAPSVKGIVEGKWPTFEEVGAQFGKPSTRKELLALWDKATEDINKLWVLIPASRFQEHNKFWDQYEGPIYSNFLYLVDNEIHHRAQGYVYLRALGIEPPAFWERGA